MDLLNVKYEISHTTQSYALRESFLPRAFMVTDYQILDREDILNFMTGPSFDPRKTLVFEKDGLTENPPRYPARRSDASGVFELTIYRPDAMVIETQANEPGYLFVSEIFYPGWKAFIDGQPTRILRGNYLFRVLEIPAGRHQVLLEFDPWTIKAGTGITLLTAFLILGFPVFRRLKRKTSPALGAPILTSSSLLQLHTSATAIGSLSLEATFLALRTRSRRLRITKG